MIKGNGAIAIKYDANGEASDWMLGQHGIVALSPELGTSFKKTDTFIIKDYNVLKGVIVANQQWIWDSIKLLETHLSLS